jgi:hypothetical protein
MESRARTPAFRILYNSSITGDEALAASRGLEPFSGFGIMHDRMEISREALRGVRRKDDMLMAVGSRSPILIDEGFFRMTFIEAGKILLGREEGAIGVGLTSQPLSVSAFPRPRRLTGTSRFDSGAIVSVARMRELYGACGGYRGRQAYPEAITYAVMHEAGHILIDRRSGSGSGPDRASGEEDGSHCPRKDCIMQENEDIRDFLERFVGGGLGFCGDCWSRISARLNELRF